MLFSDSLHLITFCFSITNFWNLIRLFFKGVVKFYLNGYDVQAFYKTCNEDLCNGSIGLNINSSVFVTSILFLLFKIF